MAVPYTFGSATSAIPLSQLDSNFATTITLGNTAIQLGNTVTTLNNMTLANVTISSGNVTITNVSVTTANVTTLNAATVIATTGNITTVNATTVVATTANATTANITTGNLTDLNLTNNPTFSGGTANGVLYLNASKVATSGSALTFDGTNLGVGTASPPSKLGVYAATGGSTTGLTVNASGNMLNLFGSSSTNAGVIFDATDGTVGSATGVPMIWRLGGSEQMRLTSTGLGIGTSSPATKLHISGSTTPNLRFEQTNSSVVHQFQAASGNFFLNIDATNAIGGSTFLIQQAGSTVATLSSTGNLGLGVTPSAWASYKALSLGNIGSSIAGQTAANGTVFTSNAYYNAGWKYAATAAACFFDAGNNVGGGFTWNQAASGTAGNAISFTQAMTLTAAGKLGIGNTNPGEVLDVTGNITLGSGTSGSITINGAGGTGACTLNILGGGSGNPSWDIGTYSSPSAFTFGYTTGGTRNERARITSGGYFKASNSGSYLNSAGAYHETVSNVSNDRCLAVVNTNSSLAATVAGIQITYTASTPNNTTNNFIYGEDSTAQRFGLRSNGGIANYQANDVNLSDRREKTDFAPAKSYLETICAIPVQTFKYIDQTDDEKTLGVVAQDVQAVAPELVHESNWAKDGDDPKMRLSIYQTDLQYALMKCIQELKAEVDSLKAQLKGA